jgi:anti-sigma regulatory factor (Ser/Thr protein kinase)
METPEGNSRRSWPGPQRRPGSRGTAGGTRATVLGSLTIPGRPEQVATARAFVSRTLGAHQVGADNDAATLLTSEIVTNAIQHTKSGVEGGTVTIVVIGVPRGVLVEIIDDGSAGTPVVKGDLYAAEGHGLFLVQHLAAQWGYLRDPAGTTVWFHLPAAGELRPAPEPADPRAGAQPDRWPGRPDHTRPTQLWAAAIQRGVRGVGPFEPAEPASAPA